MATGYFKLYRPLQDHWIYKDSRYLHLWLECLINSRWSDESKTDVYKGTMYKIERGQFLFSRTTYAERLKIDEATIRRCIDMMVKDGMIFKVCSLGKNKPTIYEVVNFGKYNPLSEPSENVDIASLETNSSRVEAKWKPSGSQVEATKEESNKSNKEKIDIIYRKIQHLNFTIRDNEILLSEGFSQSQIDDTLDSMENWAKLKTYKSAILTARKWLKKDETKNSTTRKAADF